MSTQSVRLTIDVIDEATGKRITPGNTVTDAIHGLTPEQALKAQYAYKAMLGKVYILAAEEGAENSLAVQAVG